MKIEIQNCLVCTWDELCEDNGDGFTPAELASIKAELETGKTVTVGGGAADEFTLRALDISPRKDDRRKGEEPRSTAKIPDEAIRFVAFFNGVQTGLNDEPLFELWTLTVALSSTLLKHGTFPRHVIEAHLAPRAVAA